MNLAVRISQPCELRDGIGGLFQPYVAGESNAFDLDSIAGVFIYRHDSRVLFLSLVDGMGGAYAYIDAYGEGLTVLEWRDKNARNEMKMLSAELEGILKSNINVNRA